MPRRLIHGRWLTHPDGMPTGLARGGVTVLVAAAATVGFLADPDAEPAERTQPSVAISRLAGELPVATPEPHASLRDAVALPPLRRGSTRRAAADTASPVEVPDPVATVTPEPAETATPEPAASPVADVPSAAPPPAPPASAPTAAPTPRATPAPTFDTSG